MKKFLSCCAAFSLALLACSDDSSSNSNGNHALTGSNRVDLQMASKCLDNGLGVLYKKAGSDELDKAYLVEDSTGNNQILVPELNDYCDIMADFKSKRLGDTLEIWFNLEDAAVTSCMCIKDHLFSIKSSDADAKYFKYSGEVFAVTSEPAPVRPEIEEPTIPDAPEFDESEQHQEVTDVIGYCDASPDENENLLSNKFRLVDSWDDFTEKGSDGEIIPYARTHFDGDDVVLVFEATFDCDKKVEKVNVYPSNDTLYAKTETSVIESVKLEPNEGCGCMTRAAFKLKNEGVYADAKYMVFDNHMEHVYTLKPGIEK
ncbi:hypothetical protein SAMN05720473_10117 [Fibrobacter sp. UWB15]|uniref:hypothetical protein n=1 Tax=unclassified Fibrobacter TaxID=2634177 RepID=UPI000A0DEA77|nr:MULTISPECIES: hypothetical protein [unclassified Fibrobacter]PWJ67147.1 hypothetical protein BGW99_10117 [Fibrobacter sp. UWB6]SMG07092.1 hypothetical protein SAMN05720473_10117 [Fibrobacter sp. UWB15]